MKDRRRKKHETQCMERIGFRGGRCAAAGRGAPVQGGSNLVGGRGCVHVYRENFPRIDGSTSTVPLAQAICSVLLDESREDVADLTQFSKTTASYAALIYGEKDLLIAAEPAQSVLEIKASQGFAWSMEPFAIEGLVFVVNADNPVDSLSVEQVQKNLYRRDHQLE